MDIDQVERYLALGADPLVGGQDPLSLLRRWSCPPRRTSTQISRSLVNEGVVALRSAMAEVAAEGATGTVPAGSPQVVLLSGGLDSRAILGGLVEAYGSRDVLAVTFGQPGEQDFEIAALVARRAGVRHEVLRSDGVRWTTDALVESVRARSAPMPAPFGQRYLSYLAHTRIGPGATFWDGLSGDSVGGKRVRGESPGAGWADSAQTFLAHHLHPAWRGLTRPGFDPGSALPPGPFCDQGLLSYGDQLLLGVRQRCWPASRLLSGFRVLTPFLAGAWLDFMLAQPPAVMSGQALYREVMAAAFPRLAALPTTSRRGAPVTEGPVPAAVRALSRRIRRSAVAHGLVPGGCARSGANVALRHSYAEGPLRDAVAENLPDLAARDLLPWVDVAAQMPGRAGADPAVGLRLLDLELNLKAWSPVAVAAGLPGAAGSAWSAGAVA